jgi:hypothetical protein
VEERESLEAGPPGAEPVEAAPVRAVRSAALPLGLMVLSLAVLYGVTAWVVSPALERWIECRGAFPLLSGLLLVLHHAIGTGGFSAVWAVGLLILCWQVGGRQFRLMLTIDLLLCALAAAEGLAALFLQAQRCGA